MIFDNSQPKTREELEDIFISNDIKLISEGLVSLSLYENDWRWAQNICLDYLNNDSPIISGLAATCLGHIARIQRQLDKEKVIAALGKKVVILK
jgi:hypothetical protein